MELNRTKERNRKIRRSSGIVTVDGRTGPGLRSTRAEPVPAGPDERPAPPECGPLLKLPRRDLETEVEVHQITRDEPEVILETSTQAEGGRVEDAGVADSNRTDGGTPVDSSIESFVALFREITGFADAVYPGANDSDCEITVLVGRRKLEFQVVSIDGEDEPGEEPDTIS